MFNSSGSQIKGAFIVLTKERIITDKAEAIELVKQAKKIVFAEGLATGISLALISENLVLVCSGVKFIKSALNAAREVNNDASFIVGADNDINEKSENKGVYEAEQALKEVGGFIAIPPTDYKADWDDYRQAEGLESAKNAFNKSITEIKKEEIKEETNEKESTSSLNNKLNDELRLQVNTPQSVRAKALLSTYNGDLAYDDIGGIYHVYNGKYWERLSPRKLKRKLVELYEVNNIEFSSHNINGVMELLDVFAPDFHKTKKDHIYFNNGAYDIKARELKPLNKSFFNISVNGINYIKPTGDVMDLEKWAPNFYKFINYAGRKIEAKVDGILAMLFTILIKPTKWAYFFEVTGEGGTGKSVLSEIAKLLVGENNVAACDLKQLEVKISNRTALIGKSLLILADQAKYINQGALVKKISAGDDVEVDPKFKDAISFRPDMVILAVNNHPMTFTDPDSGLARRHIRIAFNEAVGDKNIDVNLIDKIKKELPFIINHLLERFSDLSNAQKALKILMASSEAKEIKRDNDPVYDFYCYLDVIDSPTGLFIGNKVAEISKFNPEENLFHDYEALYYSNWGKMPAISVREFTRQIKSHIHNDKKKFKQSQKQVKGKHKTNLVYKENEDIPFLNTGASIPLNR